MSLFSSKKSGYRAIDGDDEENNLESGTSGTNEFGPSSMPPSVHKATEVSVNSVSSRVLNATKSRKEHRWDHIEDVDQFFSLVYEYHQGNGFFCIALRYGCSLFQFVFMVVLSVFMTQCVDYGVLFNNVNTTADGKAIVGKRHIGDAIIGDCPSHLNPMIVLAVLLAVVVWVTYLTRVGYHLIQFFEIKHFFASELKITDNDLQNVPWKEVVQRICQTQREIHLVINQEEITPLDVYQRILRYKNYMIALVDNNVLPIHISVPAWGRIAYLPTGLRLNLEWLLFWGPWAPWKGRYAMKEDYKNPEMLELLAERMRSTILWMGLVNLILCPFIFIYRVLHYFFSCADLLRRDPGFFGVRKYSNYGRIQLRHYNELDHELNLRLNRSYEFATKYMDQFTSPMLEVLARTLAFTSASVLTILLILSAWDEDVLTIQHVLTVISVTGAICVVCKSFIPKDNMVTCQNFLMRQIVANIHYAPSSWIREGHSSEICAEFGKIFQLKFHFIVEELLSPFITPFVLLFNVRSRASEIVMFFHENTRSCDAIGDVCAFSVMDLNRDGDPRLGNVNTYSGFSSALFGGSPKRRRRGNAKVELSLMNFVCQNPTWKPPAECADLIKNVRNLWAKDLQRIEQQQMGQSAMFGHLFDNLNASSVDRSNIAEENRTPPPSPSHISKEPSTSVQRDGFISESAAAAMSASVHPFTTSSGIHAPSARYPNRGYPFENDARAFEMSMNVLGLTNLLMSHDRDTIGLHQIPMEAPNTYGSTVPSTNATPFRRPDPPIAEGNETAVSNIWGVPDESTFMDDEEGDGLSDIIEDSRRPSNSYNV